MGQDPQRGAFPMHNHVLFNIPEDPANSLLPLASASNAVNSDMNPHSHTINHERNIEGPQETAAALTAGPPCHVGDEQSPPAPFSPTGKDISLLGITHPIERCPIEVLQLIFEATADVMFDPFEATMSLSVVCSKWRKIALNTPRLWREIRLDLNLRRDPSQFCSLIIPRIKKCPAIIKIHDLGADTASVLLRCDLRRIPVFEHLAIYLTNPEYFLQLQMLPPFFPSAGVYYLLVSYNREGQLLNQATVGVTWDIGKLLQHIPTSKLWLAAPCTLLVTPCIHLSAVTFLYLEEMREVDVLTIISLFTRLSHLEMYDIQFAKTASLREIYSPSLATLEVHDCARDDSWLAQVTLPALTVFAHTGPGFSGACQGFIQKHNSILELELSEKGENLPIISKIAPQIQSLVMDPWLCHLYKRDSSGTWILPFPKLNSLTVATEMAPLSLEDFEGIVCARCLPDSHGESQVQTSFKPLHSLCIRRDTDSDETAASEPWRSSTFLQSARQKVVADVGWDRRERLNLSWV